VYRKAISEPGDIAHIFATKHSDWNLFVVSKAQYCIPEPNELIKLGRCAVVDFLHGQGAMRTAYLGLSTRRLRAVLHDFLVETFAR
jgi:hypothetical protein